MRIMFDTNVLISMILFPGTSFQKMLEYITRSHHLVLSSFVVDELFAVVERKFSGKRKAIDEFLSNLTYELVYTPHHMPGGLFEIRDISIRPMKKRKDFAYVQAQSKDCEYHPQCSSIALRSISLTGIRPMKKNRKAFAYVQARRGSFPVLFRTAHCQLEVTVHGALHLAARHPASKIAVAGIRPLAVRRLFNGPDALQFAAG